MSRYGKVQIMHEFIETEWFGDVLAKLSMVPTHIENDEMFGISTITGHSRHFGDLNPGDKIPEYIIKLKQGDADEFPEFDGISRVTSEGGLLPWEISS